MGQKPLNAAIEIESDVCYIYLVEKFSMIILC